MRRFLIALMAGSLITLSGLATSSTEAGNRWRGANRYGYGYYGGRGYNNRWRGGYYNNRGWGGYNNWGYNRYRNRGYRYNRGYDGGLATPYFSVWW